MQQCLAKSSGSLEFAARFRACSLSQHLNDRIPLETSRGWAVLPGILIMTGPELVPSEAAAERGEGSFRMRLRDFAGWRSPCQSTILAFGYSPQCYLTALSLRNPDTIWPP